MAAKDSESTVSVKNLVKKSWEDQGGLKGLVVGLGVARVFEWMRNASASPDANSGLQSDIKGRGMVDEHIWLSSFARAKTKILTMPEEEQWVDPDGNPFTRATVNKRGSAIMRLIRENYSLADREQIILAVSLGEKPVTERIPTGQMDKGGKPIVRERTTTMNENGVLTIMSWFTMSDNDVLDDIDSLVFTSAKTQERKNAAIRQINNAIRSYRNAINTKR